MRNRFPLTAAAVAAAVLALATSVAQAADKPVMLKLSSWVPAQHPLNPSLQAWADDIKKASGGTITSTLFPSEQLGKAFDHYDMARDGIADFAYVSPGYQPGRFPIIAGASLPFLFANAKGGTAAIDAWYRQYAAQEMKDVHFCFAFVHDPGSFHSRKKIVLPTDINGMKIRPATGTIAQMVKSLGGTNVQASAPESRDMLERGVADAITFPWGSLQLFGIDKAVKYHMDVPLYVTPFVWVMNKAKYEAMSPAQKKVVLPSDVKGMKIRPATSTIGQMVTTLGGTNVQSSAPEARDMLERGVADALTFPWGSVALFGIDKVVKYHMDVPLYVTPFVWVMNKAKYDGLAPAQKKVIDEHCTTEWAEKVASPWADFEHNGIAKIAAEPGHEVYKLTPDQMKAWHNAMAPVEKEWAESVKKAGQDPAKVMDSLKADLAKYKAAL